MKRVGDTGIRAHSTHHRLPAIYSTQLHDIAIIISYLGARSPRIRQPILLKTPAFCRQTEARVLAVWTSRKNGQRRERPAARRLEEVDEAARAEG